MTMSLKLTEFLKEKQVPYEILIHPRRATALETAEAEHVPAGQVAKVVMVKKEGKDVMTVLPASSEIDLFKLQKTFKTSDVRIEYEYEFKDLFSDCEVGAMPPFGKLYQIPCYADIGLAASADLIFNGGGHGESIKIKCEDYLRIADAVVVDIAVPRRKHTYR